MLNKRGPQTEPCGTPDLICSNVLYEDSIFVLYFWVRKYSWIIFKAGGNSSYTCFATTIKYNQMSLISQSEVHQKPCCY